MRKKKFLKFIPVSRNFSEIEEEENKVYNKTNDESFDVVDDTREELGESFDFEILICQILYNLKVQERIVFMILLLRSDGYNIDGKSAAKAARLSFRKYNYLVRIVKDKVKKIIKNKQKYIKKRVE
jgi:hypothetical protein